jgi:3-methylfumaryl-CoA hydratase
MTGDKGPALLFIHGMIWENWIGRSAAMSDLLTPAALARFNAALDQPARRADNGDAAPQGIHWCLCLPDAPTAELGNDGHPRRDESPESFMPPIPLPRRMWAASDVEFHAPITAGSRIERRSMIVAIKEKNGSTGPLFFVDVAHETMADGVLAVSETQSVVFRAPAPISSTPAAPISTPTAEPDLAGWQWHRSLTPNPAMLFRYSALTFNSHRIHYDAPYAREEEGYPDLVVHGPLTATLLMDLAQRELGLNAITRFHMRAMSPAFVNQILHLVGREDGEGGWQLAALGPDGRTVMTAKLS